MICVDSSVWIDAWRDRFGPVASHLSKLLDEDSVVLPVPVRLEVLMGASKAHRKQLQRLLTPVPTVEPTSGTWDLIEQWLERGELSGQRFALVDLLIGALCTEAAAEVWSLDEDFQRMASAGLVNLHRP